MVKFAELLAGMGMGAAAVAIALPAPPEKEQCSVYKVQPKAVTAYVLKPPKCEPVTVTVPQACPVVSPAPPEEEKPKRKSRRRRR